MALRIGQVKAYNAGATDSLVSQGYWGMCSDGDYNYFAPYKYNGSPHGIVLRQKIFAKFTDADTWDAYNAQNTDSLSYCYGFAGAIYAGGFVYFIPNFTGIFLRYDTRKPFKEAGSWDAINVGSIDSLDTKGYIGGSFDGTYIYFAPYSHTTGYSGNVLRYDTTKPFKETTSWDAFDLTTKSPYLVGFYGSVITDGFLYLSPAIYQYWVEPEEDEEEGHWEYSPNPYFVRYDLSKPFKSAGSWQVINLTTVGDTCYGFGYPCAHNNFIYLPGLSSKYMVRYDTEKPFTDADSYSKFYIPDLVPKPDSYKYYGAHVQGHYVLFVPSHLTILVYDTERPFENGNSWGVKLTTDTSDESIIIGFKEGIADLNYVYLCPNYEGIVERIRIDPCPNQSPPLPGEEEDFSTYVAHYRPDMSISGEKVTAYWDGQDMKSLSDWVGYRSIFKDYESDFFDEVNIKFTVKIANLSGYNDGYGPSLDSSITALSLSTAFSDALTANKDAGFRFPVNDLTALFRVSYNSNNSINSVKLHLAKGNVVVWGTYTWSAGYTINVGTEYYCTLLREAGSATAQLKIYSDSARTALLSTQEITNLSTSAKWRYIYGIRGCWDVFYIMTASWYVKNIEVIT